MAAFGPGRSMAGSSERFHRGPPRFVVAGGLRTMHPWPSPSPLGLSPVEGLVASKDGAPLAVFASRRSTTCPSPPTAPAVVKGTLVHATLEAIVRVSPAPRSAPVEARRSAAPRPTPSWCCRPTIPSGSSLALDDEQQGRVPRQRQAARSATKFLLEEPHRRSRRIGIELAARGHGRRASTSSGIIDRLELGAGRRTRRHRLQDRPGAHRALRAEQARRRAVLLAALRGTVRAAAGARPVAAPAGAGGHHLDPHRAVHPGPAHQGRRAVAGGGVGMPAGRLPTLPGPLCSWCSFQAYCPGARRRPVHSVPAAAPAFVGW